MIIQSHIEVLQRVAFTGFTKKYNCWGATQYVLGKRKKYGWVGEQVMRRWLNTKTIEVSEKEPQIGDILVIECSYYGWLIHTAVYVGNNKWVNKHGKFDLAFETKEQILKEYGTTRYAREEHTVKTTIRRVKTPKRS